MSTEWSGPVTVRDLAEEAKKRVVFLIVCVVGLSYLMSLTSSSVMVNLPAALVLIVIFRYLSLDFEMRTKAATYKGKQHSVSNAVQPLSAEVSSIKIEKPDWRRKVSSPVVENAIDQFTRHIVSEWVTNLWYSRITPDRQGPEELVRIINGVAGEISCRIRNVNIIDLLIRDVIILLCSHLELFRASKAKIERQQLKPLHLEELDVQLKFILFAENKLHPSLFSAEAEHKVLQHLMDGLISFTFASEDLQCSLFRYIVRELLACAVMRPVLNLASPRFINERIESLVISLSKGQKGATGAEAAFSSPKENGSSKLPSDPFSGFLDPSAKGLELVELKKDQSETAGDNVTENGAGGLISKDPLLSMDTRSTRSWDSLPFGKETGDGRSIQRHRSGGEWGDMLDVFSERKTKALAPEHFDNMWTKGRDYKRREEAKFPVNSTATHPVANISKSVNQSKEVLKQKEDGQRKASILRKQSVDNKSTATSKWSGQNHSLLSLEKEHEVIDSDEFESGSTSSYTTDEDDRGTTTGLDSPCVRVWDGNNKRNVTSIHHPLESFEGHRTRKAHKGRKNSQNSTNAHPGRKKSKEHVWQEVERTSFLLGEGLDVLNSSSGIVKNEDSSDDSGAENLSRISSGSMASSFISSNSFIETNCLPGNSATSIATDSFLTLRCEVIGANIVKSGSRTFAVYSVSVTDMNNHSWSIKRRFRHFEELHRRLKEIPKYNLHLPPKHFLSTGLDVPIIQQRCRLLDKYLKELLRISTVSNSIEVWDFLSVDSQTYTFSSPFSIIETLSVKLDNTSRERGKENQNNVGGVKGIWPTQNEPRNSENKEFGSRINHDDGPVRARGNSTILTHASPKRPTNIVGNPMEDSSSDSDNSRQNSLRSSKNIPEKNLVRDGLSASSEDPLDAASGPIFPSEWVPPNLCQPILDLVDVIFQLQDGGWIRRKAFWVAKQVLQLGMGDAFDDWLIEKVQLLRKGSVVASGIRKIEQILWPDGIFITKHPRRQKPTAPSSPSSNSPIGQAQSPLSSIKTEYDQMAEDAQQKEAERRAQLVYKLMIEKAPAAVVGLVGSKEYNQCAKDLYYFIQSSVCLKLLAFDLLELLLLSAFPELEYVFRQIHEEKEKFGIFEGSNFAPR